MLSWHLLKRNICPPARNRKVDFLFVFALVWVAERFYRMQSNAVAAFFSFQTMLVEIG